jgi:hypothetical protein
LDAKYKYKDGSVALVRYLIQGPHYYTITTHAKSEHPGMMQFLNSFSPTAFKYQAPKEQTDTDLFFTVTTPYYPVKKNSLEMPAGFENIYTGITGEQGATERAVYRDKLIANDSTGEKIYISFYKSPRYEELKDSVDIKEEVMGNNKDWIIKNIKTPELNGMQVWQSVLTDSNSSRSIWVKTFYRDGIVFTIKTETDSLTQPSSFLSVFFKSFLPADTIKGTDPSKKISAIFFEDLYNADTAVRKKAIAGVNAASFDSTDLLQLKKAIGLLSWKDKNYLDAKKDFIDQLGTIPSQETSLYLKDIFYAAGDTVDLQYKALENLLSQQTKYSFGIFRDILLNDPPILNLNSSPGNDDNFDEETFLEGLYDSLALTSYIAKDMLPLINIDDYKYPMIQLLAKLVESNMINYKDYELYGSKFLIEAKQAFKKQMIIEKNRAIEKAQKSSNARGFNNNEEALLNINNQYSRNYGNETLSQYAVLLMPAWKKNSTVSKLLNQLLVSSDKQLKYKTMLLFIRNKKQVPDSVINNFAIDDNYRYDLYKDLNKLNKPNLFPSRYKNHLDLATSKLFNSSEYNKPDSIVFLAKKPLHWAHKDGLVYFFKFKRKKDDDWKIASVGLLQKDSMSFEFKNPKGRAYNYELDFTEFSNERLKDDEPIDEQLEQRLKKLVYAKRPGAKEFYKIDDEEEPDYRGFEK